MKEFFFLRHGQTDANLQGVMCGGLWDIDLNGHGRRQAEEAHRKLRPHAPRFKTCFASPLLRTRETARLALGDLSVPVIHVPELREWEVGHWDREPFHLVKDQFLGTADPEGGERRDEFRSRVLKGLELCLKSPDAFLIVSHGGVWMAICENLQMEPTRIENGFPMRVFQCSAGRWNSEPV